MLDECDTILKLGLLFGEDPEATTEELPEVLSFQHKLLQEYLAAVYLVDLLKQDCEAQVLNKAFPTWEKIEMHREVVNFLCGLLSDSDATPVTDHTAQALLQHTHDQLNRGEWPTVITNLFVPSPGITLLEGFQREGSVSAFNQYLTVYPASSHLLYRDRTRAVANTLSDVLSNTHLVVITELNDTDTQLKDPISCSTEIIVNLMAVDDKMCSKLWQILQPVDKNNVLALSCFNINNEYISKLSHFSKLKHLSLSDCSEIDIETLSESITSWGSESKLKFCRLEFMTVPESLLNALRNCTFLIRIEISDSTFDDGVGQFMSCPPPAMDTLKITNCSLGEPDIASITEAFAQKRLGNLTHLDISKNPTGQTAINSLFETLLATRPDKTLEVDISSITDEDEELPLSDQFINEWVLKFAITEIEIHNG